MNNDLDKEFTTKYLECNTALKRLRDNLVIDLGKFTIAILYILGKGFNKPTQLVGAEYGQIEFSVGVIRFKLQFQPKSPGIKLWCRHLEGMTYIDTQITFSHTDPTTDLIDKVSVALELVKPNDGD